MDFDSIIPLLLVIVFFVLPSLLKQVLAKKNKTGQPKAINPNPSIFDRIGDRIQQFIKDLEEQARQQRQGATQQETGWEGFAEDEELYSEDETKRDDEEAIAASLTKVLPQNRVPGKASSPAKRSPSPQEQVCIRERKTNLSGTCPYRSNPLQNAIVWSEILSKPIALRDR